MGESAKVGSKQRGVPGSFARVEFSSHLLMLDDGQKGLARSKLRALQHQEFVQQWRHCVRR
jgi:hypothetical protein